MGVSTARSASPLYWYPLPDGLDGQGVRPASSAPRAKSISRAGASRAGWDLAGGGQALRRQVPRVQQLGGEILDLRTQAALQGMASAATAMPRLLR